MTKILFLVAFLFPVIVWGQTEKDRYTSFVYESNMPEELYEFYFTQQLNKAYSL